MDTATQPQPTTAPTIVPLAVLDVTAYCSLCGGENRVVTTGQHAYTSGAIEANATPIRYGSEVETGCGHLHRNGEDRCTGYVRADLASDAWTADPTARALVRDAGLRVEQ